MVLRESKESYSEPLRRQSGTENNIEIQEDVAMRYIFDNDLHIHSKISLCSGVPEQTAERMLQ